MKKALLLIMTALMITIGVAGTLAAEEDTDCPCGVDEDGECLPCQE